MKQAVVALGMFFVVACGDGSEFAASSPTATPVPNPAYVVKSASEMNESDFRAAGASESGVANPEPTATPTVVPVIE